MLFPEQPLQQYIWVSGCKPCVWQSIYNRLIINLLWKSYTIQELGIHRENVIGKTQLMGRYVMHNIKHCKNLLATGLLVTHNLKIYTNKIFLSLCLTVPRTPVGHKNDHCYVVHITSGTFVLTYCTSLLKYPHTTVRCCYNAVNFLTNIHKRQLIACPLGMGWLL